MSSEIKVVTPTIMIETVYFYRVPPLLSAQRAHYYWPTAIDLHENVVNNRMHYLILKDSQANCNKKL